MLIKSIYAPLKKSIRGPWPLSGVFQHDRVYYYSFGRHALHQALRSGGVVSGDVVLMPELICRDLLSAVNALGATVKYYSVGRDLQFNDDLKTLPHAKAIVAVNYFGFPQDLGPFRQYCEKNESLLIEDNAHGFLSHDENFNLLGTRGDVGVFSLRKTLPLYNGAALVVNKSGYCLQEPHQPDGNGLSSS